MSKLLVKDMFVFSAALCVIFVVCVDSKKEDEKNKIIYLKKVL